MVEMEEGEGRGGEGEEEEYIEKVNPTSSETANELYLFQFFMKLKKQWRKFLFWNRRWWILKKK